MTSELREYFDGLFETVISALPAMAAEMLKKTPVYVEDYPSDSIMKKLGFAHRSQLCGLYTGIPITERSVWISGIPTDLIYIYREGVMRASGCSRIGENEEELLRQMRITVLHELGHQNGLSEDDLTELGYG